MMNGRSKDYHGARRDMPPYDEIGMPDDQITRCACGELVPKGDSVHGEVCDEWEEQ